MKKILILSVLITGLVFIRPPFSFGDRGDFEDNMREFVRQVIREDPKLIHEAIKEYNQRQEKIREIVRQIIREEPELIHEALEEYKRQEEKIREIVRQIIREEPELIYKTVEEYARKQNSAQEKKISRRSGKRITEPVTKENPVKGPRDATVTIVEFTDFQCPHCAKGSEIAKEMIQKYPGKVRLVFKNAPNKAHKMAEPAAAAALAAHKQGKFWEYHDLLFFHSPDLSEELLVSLARELSLDMERFDKDRHSETIKDQIATEKARANAMGFRGTPGFAINHYLFDGARPPEFFANIIDQILSEKQKELKP